MLPSGWRVAAILCGVMIVLLSIGGGARPRAEAWPRFRGPTGQGLSSERDLPAAWNLTEGILWRTPVPGSGWSSPVVWGERVFLTTATDKGRSCHVIAFERRTGAILWDREVFTQAIGRKEAKNSYATPTPATDGERVYAAFADGSFVALSAATGRIVWTNRTIGFYGQHGLGASLLLHRGLLITARDGSGETDKTRGWQTPWDQGILIALDARTGRERWRTSRVSSRIAHATPIVVPRMSSPADARDSASKTTTSPDHSRTKSRSSSATSTSSPAAPDQWLVSNAGDVVQVFDPGTGTLLHTVESRGEGVVPSPIVADGLVVTASGFGAPTVRAMRLGAVAGTAPIAWEQTSGVPMQTSPIHVAPHVYVVADNGILTALDASTGALAWRQRLGGTFSASPVYADGRLYLLNEDCETIVASPGTVFREIARNPLEGRCQASMAVSGGLLFIRNETTLYAIGR